MTVWSRGRIVLLVGVFLPWLALLVAAPGATVDAPGAPVDAPGAKPHWAYEPIRELAPPEVRNPFRCENAIDRFVVSTLESKALDPSPRADRATLIRRLSYDLLGLPVDPVQLDDFINDTSPDAWERVVDRFLASPHFGERWGRHWLDRARYADSDGYEKDTNRPNAWRYRDWVIDTVNDDMPFDEFTIVQLAGDLLPVVGPSERLATAFHRQTLTNTEGGTDKEQWRVESVIDRVNTTGTAWLALTVGCAQCHTHKYDQITQAEYYQLFAFFNNADEVTTSVIVSDEEQERFAVEKARFDAAIAKLEAQRRVAVAGALKEFDAWDQNVRQRVAATEAPRYHPIEIVKLGAKSVATLKRTEDGSVLVSGDQTADDEYTIDASCDVADLGGIITGFRLDVLADDSLPNKGPGRSQKGNFILTEFGLFAAPAGPLTDEHRVKFVGSHADFSQNGYVVASAIDGSKTSGWGISPKFGDSHFAVFGTEKPLQSTEKSLQLRFVLTQEHGDKQNIGRFRIRAMTGAKVELEFSPAVLAAIRTAPEERDEAQTKALREHFLLQHPKVRPVDTEIATVRKSRPAEPYMTVRVLGERNEERRTTRILERGDFLRPQEEVAPGTLAILPPLEASGSEPVREPTRLDFARWLVGPSNPLTSRVTVNQVWGRLFGNALVITTNDFGVRGEEPSHPELLDWLASEFSRRRWSMKELIRVVARSSTYHQATRQRSEYAEVDPQNRFLWRQNRFRVSAETLRDLYLSVSGLLTRRIGGPSVFPPMPPEVAEFSYANAFKWKPSEGAQRYRRGMYTFFKRTAPHPNLITFDCPDSNTTCVERRISNTPIQALTLLNNEVFVEAARALGQRVATGSGSGNDAAVLQVLFWLCLSRVPTSDEARLFLELLGDGRSWYGTHAEDAARLLGEIEDVGDDAERRTDIAAWIVVARTVLNLDEFVTRG